MAIAYQSPMWALASEYKGRGGGVLGSVYASRVEFEAYMILHMYVQFTCTVYMYMYRYTFMVQHDG